MVSSVRYGYKMTGPPEFFIARIYFVLMSFNLKVNDLVLLEIGVNMSCLFLEPSPYFYVPMPSHSPGVVILI